MTDNLENQDNKLDSSQIDNLENDVKINFQSREKIKTDEEKNNLISKLGLPRDFILNVGTIESRKNALSIVKAIVDKVK